MSQEWGKVLSISQSEWWLSMIEEHTPKHVKSILASHQPPNIARHSRCWGLWMGLETGGATRRPTRFQKPSSINISCICKQCRRAGPDAFARRAWRCNVLTGLDADRTRQPRKFIDALAICFASCLLNSLTTSHPLSQRYI
jgi:hypothetical protein